MIEILLPVYNGEKYLAEQIESILAQDNNDWVLKIRNDGSTDNSQNIIDEYCAVYPSKIIKIELPMENVGLVRSLNYLQAAEPHGEYIMFADQDDFWLPDKIEVSFTEMQILEKNNPEMPIMVCTDSKCVDAKLNVINESFFKSQRFPLDTFDNINRMIALNVVQGCTVILNRKASEITFPMPFFLNVHDMYIGARVKADGVVAYLHKPTLLYRQHLNNELGCKKITMKYYLHRGLKAISTLHMLINIKRYIPANISVWEIVRYKFVYAYKRLNKNNK